MTVTKNGYSKFVVLRPEDYDLMVQEQAKARLMARIAVAERERAAGTARDPLRLSMTLRQNMAYNVKILPTAERFLGSSYLNGATGTVICVT